MRQEECFTTLQSGHLLYHYKANNGYAGVGFLINRKWKYHIVRVNSSSPRVADLVLCITKRYKQNIVQVYMHQKHHTQMKTYIAYTITSMRLQETKPLHNSAQIEKTTKHMEIWARTEKQNRRPLGRMGNITKVQNHEYHVSEESKEKMDVEKPKRCREDRN